MALLNFSRIYSSFYKCTFVAFVFTVLPVNAASNSYSFAEFNIAFILGLTLPLVIMACALKKTLSVKWLYPAIACLFILVQLYAFDHSTQWQHQLVLGCAASYITSIYYWLVPFDKSQQVRGSRDKFIHSIASFAFCALLLSLWLFRQVDVYILWLMFVALVVGCALTLLVLKKQRVKYELYAGLVLWSALSLYAVCIYLWLNTKMEINWLIGITIVSFVIVILMASRQVVFQMHSQLVSYRQKAMDDNFQTKKAMTPLDQVTNLPTHQQGLNQLSMAIKTSPKARFITVVFKPINFHEVNKVLGHQNSDILLLQLAYNLQKCAAEDSMLLNFNFGEPRLKVSRLQGLDFMVALDSSLSKHPVKSLVELLCRKLTDSVPKAMSFKSFSLNFELAFGVAISGVHGSSADQLVAHASDALLDAERGHLRLCYYDYKAAIYSEQQLSKMEQLKQDVLSEHMTWLAHPQVSLVTKRLLGFQLVVSWPKLVGTELSELQNEVFKLAEYSGEIHRLTQQYIKQAVSILASSHRDNFHVEVSLNLSVQVLFEPELVNFMLLELERANVLPKYLVIEIDEALFFSNLRSTQIAIDQLQANGFSVAINQFTGGYEALRYLRKVAVNRVQIDARELGNDKEQHADKAIIDALINVARKMDLPVIASGINNQTIADNYLSIGGDFAQGKKITGPIAAQEINAWLIAWAKKISAG